MANVPRKKKVNDRRNEISYVNLPMSIYGFDQHLNDFSSGCWILCCDMLEVGYS